MMTHDGPSNCNLHKCASCLSVVPLVCWSAVKIAIIVLVISRSRRRFQKRYSFDLSLNSSGVGALVESGV